MEAHTAAGKLQGFSTDAPWYEAALVVGVTNALNVVADSLGDVMSPMEETAELADLYGDIKSFYQRTDVPLSFRLIARDPAYARDIFGAVRRAFTDQHLTRRLKEALAFAVSVTSRSRFGAAFHLGEMERFGVSEKGVIEVLGVTQMFSSYTKIADTLQLESDMRDIAPPDASPAPGGTCA